MQTPVIIAFDFGGTKTAVAVCELDGTQLDTATVLVAPKDGAERNLQRGIDHARALVARCADSRPVAAVGACTFGIPLPTGIGLAPAVEGWSDLSLERELRNAFPDAEISVGNDVKAAATAEFAFGYLADCDPGIYLNLGTGLAAAVVIGGVVLNGHHGASGEIGYNLRTRDDVDRPVGRAILEEFVSGIALSARGESVCGRPVSAADVFAAVPTDPRMAGLVGDFVGELAFHLVNLTNAVDPQRIVVGGGMTAAWPLLHPALRTALDRAVPYPPELVRSAFPDCAPLIGAIALGTRAAAARRHTEVLSCNHTGFVD
jgi:glucokinase